MAWIEFCAVFHLNLKNPKMTAEGSSNVKVAVRVRPMNRRGVFVYLPFFDFVTNADQFKNLTCPPNV